MKKKIVAAAAALVAGAALVSTTSADSPHWRLVAGTGEEPEAYAETVADCDVAAVYGFVEATQSWLIWFDVPAELEFLNDDFTMEPGKGYWVACK